MTARTFIRRRARLAWTAAESETARPHRPVRSHTGNTQLRLRRQARKSWARANGS